jgi:mRNA-degrading endonuclease RelE of RelBE toxin-antitoxin system
MKLKALEADPVPHDSKRLQNHDAYRLRVGEHRIIYQVHWSRHIDVMRIDKRSRIY